MITRTSLFMNGVPLSLTILYGIPKIAEDVLFDEIGYSRPYCSLEQNSFHPLRKIFSGNKDLNVAIRWGMDGANKIKPPGVEKP